MVPFTNLMRESCMLDVLISIRLVQSDVPSVMHKAHGSSFQPISTRSFNQQLVGLPNMLPWVEPVRQHHLCYKSQSLAGLTMALTCNRNTLNNKRLICFLHEGALCQVKFQGNTFLTPGMWPVFLELMLRNSVDRRNCHLQYC